MVTLNKNLPPIIGKFAGAWSSSNWQEQTDPATSPRSPFDLEIQSPVPSLRGLKNYHLGGIGLGIVVAIGKTCDDISQKTIVPVQGTKEIERSDLEDYTYVTYHGPNKSYTRVYCNDNRIECDGIGFDTRQKHGAKIFLISPPRFEDFTHYPPPDFLNSCHLCKKKLHGKDIYMYRGEKGFCSDECRSKQIKTDERNKK